MIAAAVMTIVAVFFVISPLSSSSASGESFYAGKRVSLMVGFSPGGAQDIFTRLLGRHLGKHLGKHIPGNPTVVVQNMAGGSGQVLWNWGYNVAKPDGLTIIGASGSFPIAQMLKMPAVQYDYREVDILGGIRVDTAVIASRSAVGKTVEDLRTLEKPIWVPALSATNQSFMLMALILDMLEVKWRPVIGYKGLADIRVALRQGSVDTQLEAASVYVVGMVPLEEDGVASRLLQTGVPGDGGAFERYGGFPDTPSFKEMYHRLYGKDPSGPKWEAIKVLAALYSLPGLYWFPPGTPGERVNVITEAFERVREDPDYKADSKKVYGFVLPSMPVKKGGMALQRVLREAPPEAIEVMRNFAKLQAK